MDFKQAVIAHLNGEVVEVGSMDGVWTKLFTRENSDWITAALFGAPVAPGARYQIKPRTITINGVEVPEPLRVAPEEGEYVWRVGLEAIFSQEWKPSASCDLWLKRGLLHSTEEAAKQHAEALLKCSAS